VRCLPLNPCVSLGKYDSRLYQIPDRAKEQVLKTSIPAHSGPRAYKSIPQDYYHKNQELSIENWTPGNRSDPRGIGAHRPFTEISIERIRFIW